MAENSYFFDRQLATPKAETYVTDKERSVKTFMSYMNIRLQKMFHYENLPETLPREMIEYYYLNNGTFYIAEEKEGLYALIGAFGGEPDAYYRPTNYVVANPYLKIGKTYDLQKDGVLMRNDPLWVGLYPMMARYATLMAENMLTIRTADIMLRVMALFTAPDDKTKLSAEAYLSDLEKGKLGVIADNRFFDEGVKMQSPPSNNGSYLTQFIELHQYLTGTFYNEVGLNANFNMKRESIGEGESALNEDSLLPLSEEMLRCRKEDWAKVNEMFGTKVTVEFDSAWQNNQQNIAMELEKLKNEASQLAGGSNEESGNSGGSDANDNDSESKSNDSDESDSSGIGADSDSGESTVNSETISDDERGQSDTDGESTGLDNKSEESDVDNIAIEVNVTINNDSEKDGENDGKSDSIED